MPPNIVLVMTDQQRADLSSREGFGLDTTPFLDSLARQGTWFHRAYTPMPVCCPARISTLTGRFPSAHRVRENHGLENAVYERDLLDVMRQNCYATALAGKNHSHVTADKVDHYHTFNHTGERGESRLDHESAFDGWLYEHGLDFIGQEPTPFSPISQLPYRIVSAAIDWVESVRDHPFFLWLSFPEPHNPLQVPEPYFSMFEPQHLPPPGTSLDALASKGFKWEYLRHLEDATYGNVDRVIPRARANYMGMLRLVDDQVMRFVNYLTDKGLFGDTLIVFASDHGDYVGEYGLLRKGVGMPDVLMRVPLFFVGPGVVANSAPHDAHVSLVDILPTLCEIIGTEVPRGVQGRSLWPILNGSTYPDTEFTSAYGELGIGGLHYTKDDVAEHSPGLSRGPTMVEFGSLNSCTQSGTTRMIRKEQWKLILDMQGNGELYDLVSDPWETHNLFAGPGFTSQREMLLTELAAWMMRADDPLPVPDSGYHRKTDPRNYWSPYESNS